MQCLLALAAAVLCFAAPASAQQTVVEGRLTGPGGKPMKTAHVEVVPPDRGAAPVASTAVGADGRFSLRFDTTGVFRIALVGVHQDQAVRPLFAVTPGTLKIDAQLPAEEGRGATVQVQNADANALARAAGALFRTSGLNARLARQTSRLQRAFVGKAKRGILEDPQAAHEQMEARIDSIRSAFDLSGAMERLTARLEATTDPAMRRVLLAAYFGLPDVGQKKDPALAVQAMEEVPPASGLWALQGGTLGQMLDALPGATAADSSAARAYTEAVIRDNPHAGVRGEALFERLQKARAADDVERARALYGRIRREAGGTAAAVQARVLLRHMAEEQRKRRQRIRAGRPVPHFALTAFNDSTKTYSDKSLRGQTYLIDFWAVWCGPCIAEMPNLRQAYDTYKDQGFSILSVSLDPRPDDVRAFRKKRHAMPWKHAFLSGDLRKTITRRFEVSSIPRPILVGKNGEILATQEALRGPNLDRTLEKVLGEGDTDAPPPAGQ